MPNAVPLRTQPLNQDEVLKRYKELQAEHAAAMDALRAKRTRALQGLLVAVIVIGWLALGGLRASAQAWPLGVAFFAAVGLAWYALQMSPEIGRLQRLIAFYDRSLHRVDGTELQSGRTGLDLREPGHLYEHDLDLLGPESLFGRLCTVRTGPGERGLADLLLKHVNHAEALLRQEAVKELLPQTALREKIALLGASKFQQIPGKFFDEWLEDAPPAFAPVFRFVLAITALLAVAMLLAGLIGVLPWAVLRLNIAAVLLLQGVVSLYLRGRVKPLLESSVKLQQPVKLFSEGLGLLKDGTFTSPKLRELQRLSLEPAGAVKILSQLESQLAVVEQRPKEYFLLFSLLLAAGTQAAMAIAKWKKSHAESLKIWLAAWSEFEALNAIATYAFEHPEDVWPELLPGSVAPAYEAEGLGHPLLAGAVTNDISLGDANRFYLISGSNMAGKSTLLRSIGINAVLAYAGAPVRARRLRLTPLVLGASLALTDSLAEGKSKFKAEVERLSKIVAESKGVTGKGRIGEGDRGRYGDVQRQGQPQLPFGNDNQEGQGQEQMPMQIPFGNDNQEGQGQGSVPVLFLVDEIFSGTNSMDRRTAAGAVVHALLRNGAIGALSTHDLALTELATEASRGSNVHMASPDDADPLAFDYVLKDGVNRSSNALAIIRMMGLEVEG